jgi:hypothetical protein
METHEEEEEEEDHTCFLVLPLLVSISYSYDSSFTSSTSFTWRHVEATTSTQFNIRTLKIKIASVYNSCGHFSSLRWYA